MLLTAGAKGSLILAITLLAASLLGRKMPSRWLHVLLLVGVARLLLPVAPASPLSVFNLLRDDSAAISLMVSTPAVVDTAPRILATVASPPARTGRPLAVVLFWIWAAGVAFMTGRTFHHTLRARRMARTATPLPAGSRELRLLEDCRWRSGVRRHVSLRLTSAGVPPALHGVLHPTLLLPSNWEESLSLEQLRFVFLHELAHLRRFD